MIYNRIDKLVSINISLDREEAEDLLGILQKIDNPTDQISNLRAFLIDELTYQMLEAYQGKLKRVE